MCTSSRLSDITEQISRAGNLIGYSYLSSDHNDMIVGQHLDNEMFWAVALLRWVLSGVTGRHVPFAASNKLLVDRGERLVSPF